MSTIFAMLVPCDGGIFDSLTTTSAMVGKFFMSGAYCIAYQWTAELFPTPCRSNGIAFGSMIGKIATTFTPAVMYLAVVADWLPGSIFGCIARDVEVHFFTGTISVKILLFDHRNPK